MTWPASDIQPDLDVLDLDSNSPLERAEITDSDDLGSTDAGLDPLDDSWDPPDTPSGLVRNPITPREERSSSFDRQLAAEVPDPDPYAESESGDAGADDSDFFAEGSSNIAAFDDTNSDQVVESSDGAHRRHRPADDEAWRRTAEEEALHLDPRS
ncbi:hypothetical protein CcI49_25980 [Frankia sp. CcI49]|uniref:DUF5709 domain-containing protein n=1 Tax=Parafrankia irregularis TaxID=795642 RepID=A0A0S4QQX9_9ACTN|nr:MULTISPECIES: hypothetical protein [Frankiaceae]KPM56814.1 hypothetical protein ACG83_02840 [Frankia sp. R43]MBE3202689.1 hypothetical protein [Parafrankia sp. CH37]ONH56901.1 hypothetical protein CcI49_25980 [Frankia sp. CcI49]CUU57875.1 hypothetical protein Ga0074812_11577 [Parafrankia irregularis]